jgi:hypothetical protein
MCEQAAARANNNFAEKPAIDAWIDLYDRITATNATAQQKNDGRDE